MGSAKRCNRLRVTLISIAAALTALCASAGCVVQSRPDIILAKTFDQSRFDQSRRPVVAVLDFVPDPSIKKREAKPFVAGLFNNPAAGSMIANIFSQELSESDIFPVMDRSEIAEKLESAGYEATDINTDLDAIKTVLGSDAVIIGTFKRFGFLYPSILPRVLIKFYAEYYDLRTNSKIWSVRIKRESSSENDERVLARKYIKEAVKALEEKLWRIDD